MIGRRQSLTILELGVSELISALLMLLITLAIGAFVVSYISDVSDRLYTLIKSDVERRYVELIKSLDVVFAIGNATNNEVKLALANGIIELKVLIIYINDVPAENSSITLEPLEIRVVTLKSPIQLPRSSVFKVKVVYEGGEEVIYGYVYE
jgi:archaellum component FlaG (FlaF/FlaG flagellin family)